MKKIAIALLFLVSLSAASVFAQHDAQEAYEKGVEYDERGNKDKALEYYTKAIGMDPNHFDAHSNRGLIYLSRDQYDKAIADFTLAIKLNPDSANAYYNRGLSSFYMERYDQAIADFSRSIELDPAHPDRSSTPSGGTGFNG